MKKTLPWLLIFILAVPLIVEGSAGTWDFTIEQGVDFIRIVQYCDADTNGVDITSWTIRMQLRKRKSDSSTLLDISTTEGSITFTDATNGYFKIHITAATTAALDFSSAYYDLELVDTVSVVRRILQGKVKLSKEVTR